MTPVPTAPGTDDVLAERTGLRPTWRSGGFAYDVDNGRLTEVERP